jgi:hypothetical protein
MALVSLAIPSPMAPKSIRFSRGDPFSTVEDVRNQSPVADEYVKTQVPSVLRQKDPPAGPGLTMMSLKIDASRRVMMWLDPLTAPVTDSVLVRCVVNSPAAAVHFVPVDTSNVEEASVNVTSIRSTNPVALAVALNFEASPNADASVDSFEAINLRLLAFLTCTATRVTSNESLLTCDLNSKVVAIAGQVKVAVLVVELIDREAVMVAAT